MPYEASVLRVATQQLEQRRKQNELMYAQRRAQIYQQLPRVAAIDRQLKQTVTLAATAALRKGQDPAPALNALKSKNLALQQERATLLQSKGYDPNFLKETPICANCGDKGWKGAEMCDCLRALCTEEQNKRLSSMLDLRGQSFESFYLGYYGAPYSQERSSMERVYHFCRRYAEEFDSFPYRNLFLWGTPGVGKTFLSACIARTVSNQGFSVVYDTAINVFNQFEAEKFTRDPDAPQNTRRYLSCDLMILDDLGSEMTTQFVQAALYHLVNTRLISNKSTIISTNLSPEQIASRYSMQVDSRLRGEYQSLQFCGNDIRQRKNRERKGW